MIKLTSKKTLLLSKLLAELLIICGLVLFFYSFNGASAQKPATKHKVISPTANTDNKMSTKPATQPTTTSVTPVSTKLAVSTLKPNTVPHSNIVTSSTTTPPLTTSDPTPTPTPTPAPTFHIALQLDQGYESDLNYPFAPQGETIYQYVTPFIITEDPGFTQVDPATLDCEITEAPAGSDMLCNASQKEEGSGFLVEQYYDDTRAGHYVVQVDYTIDGVTQSDAMQFDLTPTTQP